MSRLLEFVRPASPALRLKAPGPPLVIPGAGRHVPALDAIRGLAIVLVLAYHFNVGPDATSAVGKGVFALLKAGGLGVDLFFVLSGFLITGILQDARGQHHYFRDFYIRRTLRIFPLYYATLAVAFVIVPSLVGVARLTYGRSVGQQVWLWTYLTNVLLGAREDYVLEGFNHFWSLAVEEHFYLVWPFVIFLCQRERAMKVCLGLIVAAFACRLGLVLSGHHPVSSYVLTPCRMDALAAGAWLALAIRGPRGLEGFASIARLSFAACVLFAGTVFLRKSGNAHMDATTLILRPSLSTWLFGSMLVMALTARSGGLWARFWNGRLLRVFGKYSYGLYVFHYPLIPVFKKWFPPETMARLTGSEIVGRLVFITLAASVTLAAALLSWNLFEKHFLKFKDVLTGRGRDARPVPQVEPGLRHPAHAVSNIKGERQLGPERPVTARESWDSLGSLPGGRVETA